PGRVARTPALLPLEDCQALVSWSESDLTSEWALSQAVVVTGGYAASSASGNLEPAAVPADGEPASLTLAIDLTVAEDDLGVGEVDLRCPTGFPPTGEASVELDGDPIDAVIDTDGETLWLRLDEPVVDDGALLIVRFEVTTPTAPAGPEPLAAWLHHDLDGCSTPVEGELALAAEAGGDDDDDTHGAGDDDTDPGPDCDCGLGAGDAGGLGPLTLMLLALARRRGR
ncbi:MAG: hypothetical protein QGH45_21340, partial [Myxococcota bacterium]|nr:hypothetical protein [Myxococcota bacterium]